jgi:pantoate kinase
MSRSAFAPGHVSGLFAVHDEDPNPLKRGSRGAGWSLQHGAYGTVELASATVIRMEGDEADAPVTRSALAFLAPDQGFSVDLHVELPLGQGFGMSAAGTLAACLAAANLLDLAPEEALQATHRAELAHGTGLGDAVGSWFGNGEVRIRPGCPPEGWAMRVEAPEQTGFLFCVLGDPVATASIIRNPEWKATTRKHGDAAVDRLLEAGRPKAWERILVESAVFSQKLGLMPARMRALGDLLPDGVMWGQCMLGSTMWVAGGHGDLERAEALLEGHGLLIHSKVDPNGARLVRSVPKRPV